MSIVSGYSSEKSVNAAVGQLQDQFRGVEPRMVLYFASSSYEPEKISRQMQEAFPDSTVFGCSTAGEISCGRLLKDSVVAMAFSARAMKDVRVEVIEDLETESRASFDSIERHFGEPVADMDPGRYVGIILIDGLSVKEEMVIDRIGDLTNITFIGGSAGDDLRFRATHVYANGRSYRNAAVLAVLEPATEFACIKTQSFRALPHKLLVTRADEARREVIEFDGKPAAAAYAGALGIPVAQAAERFMHNPVGLLIDDDPFVRSPQQIKDGGMVFYCSVAEGMELSVLESTDIVEDTRRALTQAQASLGGVSGVVNFNCILRTLELEKRGAAGAYGALFSSFPTVGFSTYGEQYIGHINQTATMLVFK